MNFLSSADAIIKEVLSQGLDNPLLSHSDTVLLKPTTMPHLLPWQGQSGEVRVDELIRRSNTSRRPLN